MSDDARDEANSAQLDPWVIRLVAAATFLLMLAALGMMALTLAVLGVLEQFVPLLEPVAFHHAAFCETTAGGCAPGDVTAAIIGAGLLAAWLASEPLLDLALSGTESRRRRSRRHRNYL